VLVAGYHVGDVGIFLEESLHGADVAGAELVVGFVGVQRAVQEDEDVIFGLIGCQVVGQQLQLRGADVAGRFVVAGELGAVARVARGWRVLVGIEGDEVGVAVVEGAVGSLLIGVLVVSGQLFLVFIS
jgi:hypothetical protein